MPAKTPHISPQALADLDEIWLYRAQYDLLSADHLLDELYTQMCKLADQPGMGHRREDLASESLSFWPVRNYLVIYRPEADPIEIVRVLHGARDVRTILDEVE